MLISAEILGQQCGNNHFRKPLSSEEIERYEMRLQAWLADHSAVNQQRSVVTLPVIVHVIYRTDEQNITDDQIQSQLEVLNEDFRKLNANLGLELSLQIVFTKAQE